jgi:hypothetical protein
MQVSIYSMHRSGRYWRDPLAFKPERFLPGTPEAAEVRRLQAATRVIDAAHQPLQLLAWQQRKPVHAWLANKGAVPVVSCEANRSALLCLLPAAHCRWSQAPICPLAMALASASASALL